jgi:MoxR-like ATPase
MDDEKRKEIEEWVKRAVEHGYDNEKIREALKKSNYSDEDIKQVLSIRAELKVKNKLKPGKKTEEILSLTDIPSEIRESYDLIAKTRDEVGRVIIGQKEVIDAFMCSLLCDGHVLLEGVPGIAKTLLVKALAQASGCSSKRIQFTVDLLPSDIIGITTYTPQKGFETIKGPIFANFIIADEINRSPPKTQSAMIEAMQEKQVTIGKETYPLPRPFFVMANNNPLESSGVYDLPEAQVDRFLFKVLMGYPNREEEKKIMEDNTTLKTFESFNLKPILSAEKILRMQAITKNIFMSDKVKEYIVRIVEKTRKKDFPHGKYIEWGGSPRADIGLFIAAKSWALINGRNYVVPNDVKSIAHFVLRHRIILNYKARAEGITSDKIIDEILFMVGV